MLDAAPGKVIPKTVQTATERQKRMFRVKARIDPELPRNDLEKAKTGLPGAAWTRLDTDAQRPPSSRARSSNDDCCGAGEQQPRCIRMSGRTLARHTASRFGVPEDPRRPQRLAAPGINGILAAALASTLVSAPRP